MHVVDNYGTQTMDIIEYMKYVQYRQSLSDYKLSMSVFASTDM